MSNDSSLPQAHDSQHDQPGTLARIKTVARVAIVVILVAFVAIRAGGFLHIVAELWHAAFGP